MDVENQVFPMEETNPISERVFNTAVSCCVNFGCVGQVIRMDPSEPGGHS